MTDAREWLEADGLGGFASGTADGVRTRRYHAWLLSASAPPAGRRVLVSGADAWLTTASGTFALSSQPYLPGVVHPDGGQRLVSFAPTPWPTFTYTVGDGIEVVHELFVPKGSAAVVSTWRIVGGEGAATLVVRPFLAGRDYHALRRDVAAWRRIDDAEGAVRWRLDDATPVVGARSNGRYHDAPETYRSFCYEEERARGFDHVEDLASPGWFEFDLRREEATLVFQADTPGDPMPAGNAPEIVATLRARERARRGAFPGALHAAGDAYLVRRGAGRTIVAGYPWFTDWGRDTFIAMRGLCLATGRLAEARDILCEWARAESQGMLPNRFQDAGDAPEFNSVDASLWFIVVVHELLTHPQADVFVDPHQRALLECTVLVIVDAYLRGTRHGIRADADGLLLAGEPGVQLTWMDAKVGDYVVTPRSGKPVEVQALWCNALAIAAGIEPSHMDRFVTARRAFLARFWSDARGYLVDLVDIDGRPGTVDASLRPNQILAIGGLPFPLLGGPRARACVDAIEKHLLTPMGLRSLAPCAPGYAPRYAGGPRERDTAYHNGTAWPWLLGPFVEAWVRVRGSSPAAKAEARARFLAPLLAASPTAPGHVPEVADAEAPHRAGGCPFQAWSVGEALRLDVAVLADHPAPRRPSLARSSL